MKKVLIISLLVINHTIIFGQENKESSNKTNFDEVVRSRSNMPIEYNPEDGVTKGTPFLFDDWYAGSITLTDNTIHRDLQIKYDIKNDWVVVMNSKGVEIIPEERAIRYFYLYDKAGPAYMFVNLTHIDSIKIEGEKGFIQLLYHGQSKFFKKQEKFVKKIEPTGAYTATATYDEFTLRNPKYYYVDAENKVTQVKLNKKAIISLLGLQSKDLTYLKENKLNLKDEADVVQLLSFLETGR
jgi:hypothetical protein